MFDVGGSEVSLLVDMEKAKQYQVVVTHKFNVSNNQLHWRTKNYIELVSRVINVTSFPATSRWQKIPSNKEEKYKSMFITK